MDAAPLLTDVPLVLPEDEEPFVIRIGTDERDALEAGGVRYRRASERCVLDVPYGGDGVGLRASMVADPAGIFVYANAGAFPPEMWPLLAGAADAVPVLAAGAAGRPVQLTDGRATVGVRVLPGNEKVPFTTALVAFGTDVADGDLLGLARTAAVPVIGAALLALTEYRSVMGRVPDVEVPTGDGSVPLATLLDLAGGMARALGWSAVT
ncbi:MAG: hypothetical protein IT200_14655 [Thermoleophilia bacterium]|nr:hypothetical protein [Thermoleophilia bacterium]